jgi:predicted DNA-binding ribbon-helix-helix protein
VPILGKAKTRYVKAHYKEVKVRRDFYEDLRKLAEEKGLSVPSLIEEMFKQYTAPSTATHTAPSMLTDCIARRARKGDKPLNVYFLVCKDGAKAVVPYETLADLSNRFKLKIAVEE